MGIAGIVRSFVLRVQGAGVILGLRLWGSVV